MLVAQSLIKARQQVQGDKSTGWGLHSHCTDMTADPLAYVDDVCHQVLQIEAELEEQLKHLPQDRIIEFTYEDFCDQFLSTKIFPHQRNWIELIEGKEPSWVEG